MTYLALIALVVNRIYFPASEKLAMQSLTLFLMLLIAGFLCYLVNIIWSLFFGRS
jgi:hypothetical protein